MDLFLYDQEMAKAGLSLVPDGMEQMAPLDALESFVTANSGLLADGKHAEFFYGLMGMRRYFPMLLMPPDIALLSANILQQKAAKGIVLTDWTFLPVATLLAGIGIPTVLPESASPIMEEHLSHICGEVSGGMAVGWDLESHFANAPDFLGKLENGGVFISPRDLLASSKAGSVRQQVLEARLLETILQLPMPRRQNFLFYPVVLVLGSDADSVHIARVTSCGKGPGGLNQARCIETILKKDDPKALVVPVSDALRDGKLTQGEKTASGIPLRKLADVYRSQFARQKVCVEAPDPADATSENLMREVAFTDLDPLTGFADENAGSFTVITAKVGPRASKGFLAHNDTIIRVIPFCRKI